MTGLHPTGSPSFWDYLPLEFVPPAVQWCRPGIDPSVSALQFGGERGEDMGARALICDGDSFRARPLQSGLSVESGDASTGLAQDGPAVYVVRIGDALHQSLHYQLNELMLLCLHESLFHSRAAFSAVDRLRAAITKFDRLLQTGFKDALRYWRKELGEAFKLVLSAIFTEVERVMAGA
jgi:hypothetical protein